MTDLVNKEQAEALRDLGFKEDTIFGLDSFGRYRDKLAHGNDGSFISWDRRYDSDLPIPTYSQAFRWFREKYDLDYEIVYGGITGKYHAFVRTYLNNYDHSQLFTYEEAETECLNELIKIAQKENI